MSDTKNMISPQSVEHNGVLYTHAPVYYQDVIANELIGLDGILIDKDKHLQVLLSLAWDDYHGLFIESIKDCQPVIDNWIVNNDEIFHIHPEFGIVDDFVEEGTLVSSIVNHRCQLCGAECSGEIEMINNFYNMP